MSSVEKNRACKEMGNSSLLRSAPPLASCSQRSGAHGEGNAPRGNTEQSSSPHRRERRESHGKHGDQSVDRRERERGLEKNGERRKCQWSREKNVECCKRQWREEKNMERRKRYWGAEKYMEQRKRQRSDEKGLEQSAHRCEHGGVRGKSGKPGAIAVELRGTQGRRGEQRAVGVERATMPRAQKASPLERKSSLLERRASRLERKSSPLELGRKGDKHGAQRPQPHQWNPRHRVERVGRRRETVEKGVQCPVPNEKPAAGQAARTENPLKRRREPPSPGFDDSVQPPPLKKAQRGLVFDLGTYNESRRAWFNWRAYLQESFYRRMMRHRKRAMILSTGSTTGSSMGCTKYTHVVKVSRTGWAAAARVLLYLGSRGVTMAQRRAFDQSTLRRRMWHHRPQAAEMQPSMTQAQRAVLMGVSRWP